MTEQVRTYAEHAGQLLSSWQAALGAAVALLGPALLIHRHRSITARLDPHQRAAATERRGRRIEDHLTLLVAAAAATLSATGLRRVGHHQMGLTAPLDLLPFVALDIAAMVCGRRARRRAREGTGPGVSGALFWTLAAISALFSAAEAATPLGAAIRAVWPVLAAVLWEIGSLEERRAARRADGRPERTLTVLRLLHPIETLRVTMHLAARPHLSEADATRDVRISRAAYRWYRLRRAQDAAKHASRTTRWAYRIREAHADHRAQAATERAGCTDPVVLGQVTRLLQIRARQAEWAGMNLRTPHAFDTMLATLIDTAPPVPETVDPSHARRTATHADGRTDTRTGPNEPQDAQVTTSTADQPEPTGDSAPASPAAAAPGPVRRFQSDAEVQARFLEHVPRGQDGRFAWGIGKCAQVLGIGTARAQRFLDTQDAWVPQQYAPYAPGPTAEPTPGAHLDAEEDSPVHARASEPTAESTHQFRLHPGTGLLLPHRQYDSTERTPTP